MAEHTSTDEPSIAELDNSLFEGDGAPAEEPSAAPPPVAHQDPGPDIQQLLQQAGLEDAPQPQADPAPMDAAPAEEAPPPEQAFAQQQAYLNDQIAQMQGQLTQMQQPPAQPEQRFDVNDLSQVTAQMESIGLDPTDASHQFLFRSDFERRQNEAVQQQQISQMNEYVGYMQNEQYMHQAEAAVGPEVDSVLKTFGALPEETTANIKSHAAALLGQGQYTPSQAIQAAVEPYIDLLKMIQSQPQAVAHTQQTVQAQRSAPNAQAVLAAALSGRSTGHGPSVSDVSLEDLEGKLFG
jgi:hypothetical protein